MDASLVIINGNIYTMDDAHPRAEAVAVYGSRIIAVGENTEVKRMIGPTTRVIDLQGKTVIPGIIDAHVHFVSYALRSQEVNLDDAPSLMEALRRVEEGVARAKPGEWVVGGGWDKNLWDGGGFPSKESLDGVSPDNPVALRSKDYHTLWVNSPALSKASITRTTRNPQGGEIERTPNTGEATGILKENAVRLVESVIPEPTVERLEEALKPAIKTAYTLGITSIHVPEGQRTFQAFQKLAMRGELGVRVFMMIPAESLDAAVKVGVVTGFGSEKLRLGVVKLFADGSLGSQTAAMLEPYEGAPQNRGVIVTSKEKMRKVMAKASTHGLGVAVHAIGDRANRMVLDVIEERKATDAGRSTRYRVEHAQHLNPVDVERFGQQGVIASIQPSHIALDMDIVERHLGRRSREAYLLRTLLDTGAKLAFGSDSPIMSLDPLLGIYTAVTRRRTNGYPPGGWHPEERITVREAVRAYTLDAAYASGEERIKGSIERGKLADFVVLSRNIFEVSEEKIVGTRVEMTVFDGQIVYEAGSRSC
jgi:predicted amidohydrolase YtcJ